MLKTIILLLSALVILPILAFFVDPNLTELQWKMISLSFSTVLVVATLCFLLAELTGNCSQVDKIWSIVPVIYVWQYAHLANYQMKFVFMAVLITLWGVRLTYNFSRRGAYQLKFWAGEEDYRWGILRQNPLFNSKLKWTLFNLFFISFYQNILIWLITLPAVYAYNESVGEITGKDFLVGVFLIAFLIIETIADQQQWKFQNEKHKRIREGVNNEEPYSIGFIRSGLWRIVRHPNYASEQSIWLVFYFFSVVATGNWFNGSLVGAILLMLLFQGSADFSEGISKGKYSEYSKYIETTPRFVPWFKKRT